MATTIATGWSSDHIWYDSTSGTVLLYSWKVSRVEIFEVEQILKIFMTRFNDIESFLLTDTCHHNLLHVTT